VMKSGEVVVGPATAAAPRPWAGACQGRARAVRPRRRRGCAGQRPRRV